MRRGRKQIVWKSYVIPTWAGGYASRRKRELARDDTRRRVVAFPAARKGFSPDLSSDQIVVVTARARGLFDAKMIGETTSAERSDQFRTHATLYAENKIAIGLIKSISSAPAQHVDLYNDNVIVSICVICYIRT